MLFRSPYHPESPPVAGPSRIEPDQRLIPIRSRAASEEIVEISKEEMELTLRRQEEMGHYERRGIGWRKGRRDGQRAARRVPLRPIESPPASSSEVEEPVNDQVRYFDEWKALVWRHRLVLSHSRSWADLTEQEIEERARVNAIEELRNASPFEDPRFDEDFSQTMRGNTFSNE